MRRLFTSLAMGGVGLLVAGSAFAQTTNPGPSRATPSPGSGPTMPPPAPPSAPGVGTRPGSAPIGPGGTQTGPSVGQPTPGTTTPGTSMPGATAGTPGSGMSSMPSATPGRGTQEQVRSVQQALQGKGMDPGPIDGVVGPKTEQAVRDFQRKENLPQTGRMDAPTLQKLGVSAL